MYKVRFRQNPGDQKRVLLSISVGGEPHEGDKFAETMRWAASRFETVGVCISDSFQRNRLQLSEGLSPEQAYRKALDNGTAWAFRNTKALNIGRPIFMTRWDFWRQHPDFADVEDAFAELAVTNKELAATTHEDALFFLRRNPEYMNSCAALELCHASVIEELAVHTLQAREYGGCRVYPGTQLLSLELLRNNGVPEAPYGLQNEKFIRINLERRKLNQPAVGVLSKAA